MKVLEPRDINGYLDQSIKAKFGSQRKFSDAVRASTAKVSNVVNYHWNLTTEEKQRWATALDENVNDLFGE